VATQEEEGLRGLIGLIGLVCIIAYVQPPSPRQVWWRGCEITHPSGGLERQDAQSKHQWASSNTQYLVV